MFWLMNRQKTITFKSPVIGKAIALTSVPDEVFATKMVGDGLAFEPSEGIIYAPVSGVIDNVFPTKHAIGIKTKTGLKVIIHIGIDTVNLKGNGFECLVQANQAVRTGARLMTFDMDLLNEKAKAIIIPVIITNMELVDSISFQYGKADLNSTVMTVRLK